jgi:uncharacterized protein YjiS (DUF1127 family)
MSVRLLPRSLAHAPARPIRGARQGWLAWLARMLHAIETRRHLAEMDDRMLKDIGITRLDAYEEIRRAPWDNGPR